MKTKGVKYLDDEAGQTNQQVDCSENLDASTHREGIVCKHAIAEMVQTVLLPIVPTPRTCFKV
jgi:hypothetical protein